MKGVSFVKKTIIILLCVIVSLIAIPFIIGLIMAFSMAIKSNGMTFKDFIFPITILGFIIFCFVMVIYMSKIIKNKKVDKQNNRLKSDNKKQNNESRVIISYERLDVRILENDDLKDSMPQNTMEVIEESHLQEIREVIEEPYSQEIRKHMEEIKNSGLKEIIIERIKKGVSLPQIAKEISEKTGQDLETVYGFVEFESALFHENDNFRTYETAGVEQYQFWSEHELTVCPICAALDMKVFNVKDRKIGVNAPPMHLGCHCITVEYDPFEREDYINSGLEPPKERETWQQWYDKQTKK